MLADRRSFNLATKLRRTVAAVTQSGGGQSEPTSLPDFDDNLRQAFRQETELFFDHVLREDRSVLELIKADYTFLNERLARHYGIPDVYGSRFRRVTLGPDSKRGGLLRQGSVLPVTSFATRTSPIIRGVVGPGQYLRCAAASATPNVPSLDESTVSASLPMRERLAAHRSKCVCASCHRTIDPVGFSLGKPSTRWTVARSRSRHVPIDVSGALPESASSAASRASKTDC